MNSAGTADRRDERHSRVRQLLHHARARVARELRHHHDVVLRSDLAGHQPIDPGTSFAAHREHRVYSREVERIHSTLGRAPPPDGLEMQFVRRRGQGLRFFALTDEHGALASTWISPGAGRCFEEYGLRVCTPADHLWLIDVFVAPRARGRRLFSHLLDVTVGAHFADRTRIWSDVSASNLPSLAAHHAYGFIDVGQARSVCVATRLMWRAWTLPEELQITGYQADRRLVHTGAAYREFLARYAI